jgi:hypothetical protein
METRAPMRSPFRLVPLVIAVVIVAVALWEAARPPAHATKADIAAAEALKGQCLARTGGTVSYPSFSATPVSCSSKQAYAKVTKVLVPGKPGSCAAGSAVVQVLQVGVSGEPTECIVLVRR